LFQLINGNTEYRVRRDPDSPVLSGEVRIPAYYRRPETGEYLPVKEIGATTDVSTGGAFYNTRITVIYIPETVTVIGNYAFAISAGSTSYLTTVNIEEDSRLQRIGNYAFSDCNNLTGITIPAGVNTIGNYAFYNCASLTGITIPEGVTAISQYAFSGCTSLTGIIIHEGITSIGSNAFSGCTSLTGIIIHEGITSIGGNAFSGCASLTEITIPANVTSIGSGAFSGCTNLTDIIIDNDKVTGNWGDRFPADNLSVTFKKNIGSTAFYNCTRLTNVIIEENVAVIGSNAFTGCTGLTDIIIDTDKVTTTQTSNWGTIFPANNLSVTFKKDVSYYAFYRYSGISGLTNVTFEEGVTSIGWYAFYNCTSLTSVTIRTSVTSIGSPAFYGCTSLTGITVDTNNSNYASQDGILYNKAKTSFVLIPQAISGSVTIPESVTSIGGSAFSGCTGLTGITIPASVTTIGAGAFSGCTGLTGITIPEGVTSIGSNAFSGCTNLRDIVIDTDKVTATYNHSTENFEGWGTIFPANTLSVTFTKNVVDNAFRDCSRLVSVTIEEGVTSIGDSAFYNCTSLTSITIPASVTSIGAYAFYNTAWFNNKSDGIVYVNKVLYAYRGTMSANTVINGIQADTTAICGGAFHGCTGLTGITIPASVTSIGDYAFMNCTGLTSITIPATVTSVGQGAFAYWTNLQTINVPFANANARPSGWASDWSYGNYFGNAVIKYWNGSSYQ